MRLCSSWVGASLPAVALGGADCAAGLRGGKGGAGLAAVCGGCRLYSGNKNNQETELETAKPGCGL